MAQSPSFGGALGRLSSVYEGPGAPALTPSPLLPFRSTLCTAGRVPASRRLRRSLQPGCSPTRLCARPRPTPPRARPPTPSVRRNRGARPAPTHAGSSRGRGNPSCTFTGSPCICISCQRLPHPSLEVLVPESSAALNPLSSRTEAVLVCAGPLPSADWGEQGGKCCSRALSLPSPSLLAPAAGGRSLLQMAGMLLPGTGMVTCLPCALLFPHLVMTLVCPGVWKVPCPCVPRDSHALPRMSSPSSSWGLLQWDGYGPGPRVSGPFVLSFSPSSPSLQAQG